MISIANVDTGSARAITLRQNDASLGEVIVNKVLTTPGQSIKRHIGKQALVS
jgi:cytochrome P450/NADPH-cytochrome P450 reductase